MRGAVALVSLSSLLCACTHDFGSFSYRDDGGSSADDGQEPRAGAGQEEAPISKDGGQPMKPSLDAGGGGSGQPPGAEPDAAASDAGGEASDGGDAAAADTGAGDAGDAGEEPVSPETMMCRSDFMSAGASESCASCGCDQCAGEATACLGGPDADADPLCTAVVQCALQHDCGLWGCYCRTPQCARNSPGGDGPCTAAIEAAAGGAKAVVMAKWESNDLGEPLVRARNLIACTLGLDAQHPLGPITGRCAEACP